MTTTRRTRAADRGARDDDAGEPVRARSARGRQAERRVLGSLGARRQQATEQLSREWAEKEKVDLTVDFITSNGDKDLLTAAAEAQARTGHDIMQFTAWYAPGHAASLEPVDDVMATLIQQNGKVSEGAEYLGKQDGHWVAVPTSFGSTLSPPCARIDLIKQLVGLDVTKMYPAGAPPDKELQDQWNWEFFTQAAEKCAKGGHPFGMPLSTVQRRGAVGRRDVQQPRRAAGGRQRPDHGQQRRDPEPCWNGSRRPRRSSRKASMRGTTPRTTRR